MAATTNRVAGANGAAQVENKPAATEGQDVAELRHLAARAACDVEYALKQLRQYRDIGRATDALERVAEALGHMA